LGENRNKEQTNRHGICKFQCQTQSEFEFEFELEYEFDIQFGFSMARGKGHRLSGFILMIMAGDRV